MLSPSLQISIAGCDEEVGREDLGRYQIATIAVREKARNEGEAVLRTDKETERSRNSYSRNERSTTTQMSGMLDIEEVYVRQGGDTIMRLLRMRLVDASLSFCRHRR